MKKFLLFTHPKVMHLKPTFHFNSFPSKQLNSLKLNWELRIVIVLDTDIIMAFFFLSNIRFLKIYNKTKETITHLGKIISFWKFMASLSISFHLYHFLSLVPQSIHRKSESACVLSTPPIMPHGHRDILTPIGFIP